MASRINARIKAKGGATRLAMAFLWLAGLDVGLATAEEVPLPKPRPSIWIEPHTFREAAGPDFDSTQVTSAPTECDQRIRAIAAIEPMPRLIGPELCGGEDMVRLDAVTRSGGVRIDLKPAPVLRCTFAESVAAWLRDEAAPRLRSWVQRCVQSKPTTPTNAAAAIACREPNSASTARVTQSICVHSYWQMAAWWRSPT